MTAIKYFIAVVLVVSLTIGCRKNDVMTPVIANNDIVETTPPNQKPVTLYINDYVGGYYEALPVHYAITTKKYPLLVFLHGGGQVEDGDKDLPLVLNDGAAKEINNHVFPASFFIKGNNFSFIVLSPQFRGVPPDSMVKSFIDYGLKNYRVDSSRIYLSGLSMGGILSTEMAGLYTSLFAAVAPIAGESYGPDADALASNIASDNLPLWVFHNNDDPSISSSAATYFVSLVNQHNPITAPRLTIFQAYGHDAWSQALDPIYKENNMNVYQWMLQYKRN